MLALARAGARASGLLQSLDRRHAAIDKFDEHALPDALAFADGLQSFDDILLFHSFTVIPAME